MTRRRAPLARSRAEAFRAAATEAKPDMSPADEVLLTEACRLVDRLDRMEALIAGDVSAWARIEWPFEEAPAALVISSVVSESRSLTTELRQVLKALDLPVAKAAASGPSRLELLLGGGAG